MSEGEKPNQSGTEEARRLQSAEYIADLTGELSKLARGSRLDLLAYLLDIASLEAKTIAGNHRRVRSGRRTTITQTVQG